MTEKPRAQVVAKEDAVFWMDGDGRWCNAHGRFENPRISAYFHSCIDRDEHGYFVTQEREGVLEKVYFRVEDTAFFVVRVETDNPFQLNLNTGESLRLNPSALFVENDRLYLEDGGRRIRFSERAAMAMGPYLLTEGDLLVFRCGDAVAVIPER